MESGKIGGSGNGEGRKDDKIFKNEWPAIDTYENGETYWGSKNGKIGNWYTGDASVDGGVAATLKPTTPGAFRQ